MLSIGIVGLPNVGKSTLFNALTENNVLAANYPFATIEPNTGIVPVPDVRLQKLSEMYGSAPVKPATVTFVDIAGLVAGAHKGEGMGNAFLSHIRETDAIVQVVRAFEDDDIQHVDQKIDPKRDIEIINTELILADIQTIDSHLPKLQKQAKSDPATQATIALLEQLKNELDTGKLATNSSVDLQDVTYLNLLSAKPFVYVFNVDEITLGDAEQQQKLASQVDAPSLFICAKLEHELNELDPTGRLELMGEYGLKQSGLEQLAAIGYQTLKLQSYLTAGEKEVRAWTIPAGATAPQAAGVIHGDFERGFIAAEVVDYFELINAGSRVAAKAAGKVRTEGKTYVMQPNDVVEFRFNV